jgi:probable rRNA maturation factor
MSTKRRELRATRRKPHPYQIENCQESVKLPLSAIDNFLNRINRELRLSRQGVFVRFVADTEMKRLNHTFRKKTKTTDVLSFPAETRSTPRSLRRRTMELRGSFLGDIAISPTVARRNAKMFDRTMTEEICILMLHGVLHLLGYDHETDRGEMERVESTLRRRLRLS